MEKINNMEKLWDIMVLFLFIWSVCINYYSPTPLMSKRGPLSRIPYTKCSMYVTNNNSDSNRNNF